MIRFSLQDRRLFEIIEVEITRADCMYRDHISSTNILGVAIYMYIFFKWHMTLKGCILQQPYGHAGNDIFYFSFTDKI